MLSGADTSSFFVQALDSTGPVTLIASAPGYTDGTGTITLAPSGFVIHPSLLGNFTTTTFSASTSIPVYAALLNATTLAFAGTQPLRGGIAPVTVSVTATDLSGGPGVGTIVGSPVTFNGNDTTRAWRSIRRRPGPRRSRSCPRWASALPATPGRSPPP